MISHTFDNGKYTVVFHDSGKMEAFRYGVPWRNLTGDGMVLAMLQDFDFLKEQYALEDLQVTSLLKEIDHKQEQLNAADIQLGEQLQTIYSLQEENKELKEQLEYVSNWSN